MLAMRDVKDLKIYVRVKRQTHGIFGFDFVLLISINNKKRMDPTIDKNLIKFDKNFQNLF